MVKNKTGGNKAKKQGRKHINIPQNRNTRFAKEDGEMYAVITKIFGGPNCEAKCNDGKTRMCIIRNKFRGRGKRDNNVALGTWVLVGKRPSLRIAPSKTNLGASNKSQKPHDSNCHNTIGVNAS